ncbi:MAG: hypothetical protein IJZ89_08395 [Clostridia bacterium]|nr:hypothetical protein [Clostridia bacterium]
MRRFLIFFTVFVFLLPLNSCCKNEDKTAETAPQTEAAPLDSEKEELLSDRLGNTFIREYMFERNYADFTYDLSYLLQSDENEKLLVTAEELEAWLNDVYNAKSDYDKTFLPVLYQAIHELGVNKQDFAEVNALRKETEHPLALEDHIIDLLFTDINEDHQAVYSINRIFCHPLAYCDGWSNYSCEYVLTRSDPYKEFGYYDMDRYIRRLRRECEALGIDPIAIYGVKTLTIDEMVDIVRDEEGNICEINIESEYFIDKLSLLGDYEAFPENAYRLNITGFDTEVYFALEQFSSPTALTAYGKTVELFVGASLYGNCGFNIFEYNGAVIFTWDYYGVGYNYVIGEDFTACIEPSANDGLVLMLNDEGKLIYERVNICMASIQQTGGLSSAIDYDTFYSSKGMAEITDGKIVLNDPFEYYTISDKYDLDEEFETSYKEYYPSIEAVFEKNKELYKFD